MVFACSGSLPLVLCFFGTQGDDDVDDDDDVVIDFSKAAKSVIACRNSPPLTAP